MIKSDCETGRIIKKYSMSEVRDKAFCPIGTTEYDEFETNCMKEKEVIKLFMCQCGSTEHVVIAQYWPDDDDVYLSVHLAPLSFWQRMKNGIKYIFGYRSKYGDFDEIILKHEDWEKAQVIADHLRSIKS